MECKVVQNYVITPIVLGKGCFGVVYRGYVKDNKNELLAVKSIPVESIKNQELVKREIDILLKLRHQNIVKQGGTGTEEVQKRQPISQTF